MHLPLMLPSTRHFLVDLSDPLVRCPYVKWFSQEGAELQTHTHQIDSIASTADAGGNDDMQETKPKRCVKSILFNH